MDLRLSKAKEIIANQNLDAILISSLPNISYLTGYPNFSHEEHEAFLLLSNNDSFIFTDARYTSEVKRKVINFDLITISAKYNFYDALKEIIHQKNIKTIGIEESDLRISEYKILKRIIPNIRSAEFNNLRILKSPTEIECIKKACRIGDEAFKFILKQIKPGLTESQIAYKLENYIFQKGADLSFSTIIAFGKNAAVPHHMTGKQKLKVNDLVLIDFGVKFGNYCSDMTRTVFIGKANKKQKNVYKTVLNAQSEAIKYLKDNSKNVYAKDVDQTARSFILSHGYPTIPHSLGHGIGIQIHEPPTLSPLSKHLLVNDMVFSIEPGIYLDNEFGIRIEDLFVLQKEKLIQLTNSPKELIEL